MQILGCNLIKQQRKEVVNLAVSQLNGCKYCQAAHTATGKMNGFTDDQIIELRKGEAS
jgi:AhpD family alkylhydroperoxidase